MTQHLAPPLLQRVPPPARSVLRTGRWWGRQLTSPLRPLPDFVIIGTQKGGTTSLYDYLSQHPSIRPAIGKGLHYFNEHYARGPVWYRANFPVAGGLGHAPRWLTGEASPDYMPHPLVPARMAELVPNVRLVLLLRDPIRRAQSHYHHERIKGREPLPLEDALDREGVGADIGPFGYLRRGLYAEQIERWLAFFPRAQFAFLRSEDLYRDPEGTTHEVLSFLGLPPCPAITYRQLNAGSYSDLDDDLRARLHRYFAPHNARLRTLLGPRFTWESDR